MSSTAFDRIMNELTVHPKERVGFKKTDFTTLVGDERQIVFERMLQEVENGWGYSEQLEWMCGDSYVQFLKKRLASLQAHSHGLVFLPYFIFLKTGEREYVTRMMAAILDADPKWEQREAAVGGYLRELVGKESVFWDFCRYIILNVPDYSMKKDAMLWLAREKGYPLIGLSLPPELAACVDALAKSGGTDIDAKATLDRLHANTGNFVP